MLGRSEPGATVIVPPASNKGLRQSAPRRDRITRTVTQSTGMGQEVLDSDLVIRPSRVTERKAKKRRCVVVQRGLSICNEGH